MSDTPTPTDAKNLRRKLGLLVVEHESLEEGLLRIELDQARRTEERVKGQKIRSKQDKKPRVPKVKREEVKPEGTKKTRKRKPKAAREGAL